MTITINPNGDVLIDGVNRGHFLDFHHNDAQPRPDSMPANHPERASRHAELKAAWDIWHVTQLQLVQENTNAMNAQMAEVVNAANQKVSKIQADATLMISDLQAKVDILGGNNAAQVALAQRQRDAADAFLRSQGIDPTAQTGVVANGIAKAKSDAAGAANPQELNGG